VRIPKCRKKKLYGEVVSYLEEIFHELTEQRESRIVKGQVCPDRIHMLVETPPKYEASPMADTSRGKAR
jgi:putative transposase